MTYPETASSNGSLPLRFWFVNTGSSRIYQEFDLRLQLQQDDATYELPLHAATNSWLTGDLIHNEIIQLPDLLPGQYTLSLGLFFQEHSYIKLNQQGKEEKGFYELGLLSVESISNDPLRNIWDTYYPEGYYPLEDPQVPDQES